MSVFSTGVIFTPIWRRGVVVITTAQLHSTKPELRFWADSNPARGVSEIRDDEDLWQWSRLEIKLNAFRRSTIPQKQFIIIIIISNRSEVFSKKGVLKNSKIFSEKHLCQSQESLVKPISCEFCGIFKNIYFVEHRWTHTYVKWSNDKIFSHKYIHRKTPAMVSIEVQL